MLKNYLKITIRNLRRQPGFTAINLVGLAVGLACCILVLLHVTDELSYDKFLSTSDRLYRVTIDAQLGEQEIEAPLSPAPMAAALAAELPEVEAAARVFRSTFVGAEGVRVSRETSQFLEQRFYYVDSTFFQVMPFRVISGSLNGALDQPNSIVLTQTMANKYFGHNNPINQTLRINNEADYLVTAVVENVPSQSHWHFDFLASLSTLPISQNTQWVSNPFTTYVLLKPDADLTSLQSKIQAMVDANVGEQFQAIFGLSIEQFVSSGGRYNFGLQPVTEVHLYSQLDYEFEPNSSITYVYIFSIVALLILIIACFNFMNLSTARSANRAKEVGVRKALGSFRKQLVLQFLIESVLLCALALVAAIMLVKLALPTFNSLLGKSIQMAFFDGGFLLSAIGFVLLLGILAGSYPAFFLTSFNTISVLKGTSRTGTRKSRLRSSLVVLQFAISITLMLGTAVVYQQVDFIQDKRLGFDKDYVMVIERGSAIGSQREVFKQELKQHPGVLAAAGLENLPGSTLGDDTFRPVGSAADEVYVTWVVYGDHDVIETMGMEVTAGRDFSRDAPRDSSVLILNQAAVQQMGIENPVGQQVSSPFASPNQPDRIYNIVGTLADVHFESLHQEIRPLAIELAPEGNPLSYLIVRVDPTQIQEAIAHAEATWTAFVPGESFEYSFLDQHLDALYKADRRTGQLVGLFAGLAIFVACLGLFGLSAFMAESRIKEVGIRKVLGASAAGIVGLFSKDFLKLIIIAFALAAPIAFVVVQSWLEAFAYRVEFSWSLYVLVGCLVILIAFVTVGFQCLKAALTNPVKALRYE